MDIFDDESVQNNEDESDEDNEDADALLRAEGFILDVARQYRPDSLSNLRSRLVDAPEDVDRALLPVALWSLLNENQLELTPERTLRVAD